MLEHTAKLAGRKFRHKLEFRLPAQFDRVDGGVTTGHAWEFEPVAELVLTLAEVPDGEVELYGRAEGAVGPGVEEQAVTVEVNGVALDVWRFTLAEPWGMVRTVLPPSIWTRGRRLEIVLRPQRPTSPRQAGWSADDRKLGVALRGLRLRSRAHALSCTMGEELEFKTDARGRAALWSGWSEPDAYGVWSIGPAAELVMRLDDIPDEEVELYGRAEGAVGPGMEEQAVAVEVNGVALDVWRFTLEQPRGMVRTVLPPSIWTRGHRLEVVLRPQRPTSPRQQGWSEDDRKLGVALRGLGLRSRAHALSCTVGEELEFKTDSPGRAALWSGWSEPDAYGVWSIGPAAELVMRLDDIPDEEVELYGRAEGAVGPGMEEQAVAVEVNGVALDVWRFTLEQPRGMVRTVLPPSIWTRGHRLEVVLRPQRPTSPQEQGWSADDRKLGVALRVLGLRSRAHALSCTMGEELEFKTDSPGRAALWSGWSEPDAYGVWSLGPVAELVMTLAEDPDGEMELYGRAEGAVGPGMEEQAVAVEVNGVALDVWRFTLAQPRGMVRTVLPPSIWTRGRRLEIVLRPERPTSPQQAGWSEDDRRLGIYLKSLMIEGVRVP